VCLKLLFRNRQKPNVNRTLTSLDMYAYVPEYESNECRVVGSNNFIYALFNVESKVRIRKIRMWKERKIGYLMKS
jgi:hypothetical protein